jgi:hypothetical protein
MYTVTLTSEQHDVLLDLLECAVSELHTEIVHTDNRCMKDALKDRKHILQQLLDVLRSLQPNSTVPDQ